MVIEDMRNTGVLGQPEEWFLPWKIEKERVDWKQALASVIKRATGENGVAAIKIMANQVYDVDRCLSSVTPAMPEAGDFPYFRSTFRDAVWVQLRRRDVVEQAISRAMSAQTGINHATARPEDDHFAGNLARGLKAGYNDNTTYRYDVILQEVTSIVLENLTWDRFFESNGITPVEFGYETLSKDAGMAHLDIMARLVGQTEAPPRSPRKMIKLGNQKNQDWKTLFYQDSAENRFRGATPAKAVAKVAKP